MNIKKINWLASLFLSLIIFSCSAYAAKSLRFELTIVDVYDPFLTPAENEQLKQQFTGKSMRINALYSAKTGRHYERNCMVGVTCFPFGGKWVKDYQYETQTSHIIGYDLPLRKIMFEVPERIKSNKLKLGLEAIEIFLMSKDPKESYQIRIPYQRGKDNYIIKNLYLANWPLEKPIATEKNSPSLSGYSAIAVQMNSINAKSPTAKPFTQQEKNKLFGYHHLHTYDGYVRLAIPNTLPAWQNMGRPDGYGQAEGVWLHDRKQRMEAISLQGQVFYPPKDDSFSKYEIWLKTNNQLSHIYSDPVHYTEHKCGLVYGVIFYPDGTEQRYIVPKLSFSEHTDEFAIETKKQLVTPDDLSFLTEFEKSKELYYAAMEQHYKSDESGELAACKRIINDAKHILTSSRSTLEKEYAQYQKLIQDASPKNVELIAARYGTNGQQVYYANNIIKEADAKSFQVLNKPSCPIIDRPTIKCSQHVNQYDRQDSLILAKDKNHVYDGSQIFNNNQSIYRKTPSNASTEVDPKSFLLFYIVSGNYYYIDKYRIYRLSSGTISASFDTQGTVYGPMGQSYNFIFLDDNGFFNVAGDNVGLCNSFFDEFKGLRRGTKGKIKPLAKVPAGFTWAVEDDNFEYYLTDISNKNISYMINKKTKLKYPVFMGDGNCRKSLE